MPSTEVFALLPSLLILILKNPIKKADKFCKKIKLKNAQVFSKPISPCIIGLIKTIYNAIINDPKNIAPKNLVIVAAE